MESNSTDHIVLKAQLMANDNEASLPKRIDNIIPLIVIIVAGIALTFIALYSATQWENHATEAIAESNERAYHNEVGRNLNSLKQNTRLIQGLIQASSFVTQDEFDRFSQQLLASDIKHEFIAVLNYQGNDYVATQNGSETPSLDQLKSIAADAITSTTPRFISMALPGSSGHLVCHMLMLPTDTNGQPLTIISGMPAGELLRGIHIQHPTTVSVTDSFDQHTNIEILSRIENVPTHTSTSKVDDVDIILDTPLTLKNPHYLKWIMVALSLLFTASLCAQYILAHRSLKNMANLAVQKTNDLNAINSGLSDEIASRIEFQAELMEKNQQIHEMNLQLEEAQNQLIQQEKLASLGQLAAGVAHEINNPVGFINSNLTMLKKYAERALSIISALDNHLEEMATPELKDKMEQQKKSLKYDSVQRNMLAVIDESVEGVFRVKQIVQDLKDFSRIDEAEWQWADIHSGIDSTLNIVWNELKYKAEVHKDYGELPNIECVPSQINQVIMNLLVNSAHSMENSGNIFIRTSYHQDTIKIEVEDDGCGIPDSIIGRIFDPFFTTKEVGKGTGLGLSLSYGIIKKHHGDLSVKSKPGQGTTFTITLPISQHHPEDKAA